MSTNSERRQSSEYSVDTSSYLSKDKPIEVDEDDKKNARSHIYGLLFKNWMAKVAIIPSFITGAAPILIYLVLGDIITAIAMYNFNAISADEAVHVFSVNSWYMCIVAIGSGIMKFLDTFFWIRLGSSVSTKLKHDLFQNMMKSEVSFFDINPIGNILTLLSEDAQSVQDAFGTTKGTQIMSLGQFLAGIILAYVYSWRLALIATATIPLIFILLIIVMPPIIKNAAIRFEHVAVSMTIAEETLSSIRTVRGFNREKIEVRRFMKETKEASKYERKIGFWITLMVCFIQVIIWGATLGNLYWGATLVDKDIMEIGDLFSVFGFTMFGCFGVIGIQTSMQGEQKAISSGARILKLSQHIPEIPFDGGDIIEDFKGHIEFRCVSFKYPTRDVYVLKNVSFEIKPGQIGALVGHSGSGKSTCVQLLERYYDATEGLVLLDGHDIKTLDPRWLHRKIALVSQEPTLFHSTIEYNIKYGASDATEEQVNEAAEVANAMRFIKKLDKQMKTDVGEKGASLSGGQRQRIAIARAVIKNPVILITDEATSALDSQSEKKVQHALDKVMENRTAVIVAHRLSTIRNAHVIYVFDAGEIKEVGTHDSLIAMGGYYFTLVERQLTQEDSIKKKNADLLRNIDTTDKVDVNDDSSDKPSQKVDKPNKKSKKPKDKSKSKDKKEDKPKEDTDNKEATDEKDDLPNENKTDKNEESVEREDETNDDITKDKEEPVEKEDESKEDDSDKNEDESSESSSGSSSSSSSSATTSS